MSTIGILEDRDPEVRNYCRIWPKVFGRPAGSSLYDEGRKIYLDLFTGASALNYGHNNPALKRALLGSLADDRVIHSLGMYIVAKSEFLTTFDEHVPGALTQLRGRGLVFEHGEVAKKGPSPLSSGGLLVETARSEDDVIKLQLAVRTAIDAGNHHREPLHSKWGF